MRLKVEELHRIGYLQAELQTTAYQKEGFPKACQRYTSSWWHFSFISPKVWILFQDPISPNGKQAKLFKTSKSLCLLPTDNLLKNRFYEQYKKRNFLLFNLTLFRSRISSTQLHHCYNVLICSHGGLRLQGGVHLDYLQRAPAQPRQDFKEG